MQITLTASFQIDYPNPITGLTEQKTITKLECKYIKIDYQNQAVIAHCQYKDDSGFQADTHNSFFGAKTVDPYLSGADFTSLDTSGVKQSTLYSLLQSKYAFLAGSVA